MFPRLFAYHNVYNNNKVFVPPIHVSDNINVFHSHFRNIVSVLKYVSNAVPSEFKVTDLAVNNNVPYHRLDISITDKLEFEKKPLMSITLSGFLQMDGDRSARVLRPFRSQLERDRQFKGALFSEQEDGTRYKTPYIIDLIL